MNSGLPWLEKESTVSDFCREVNHYVVCLCNDFGLFFWSTFFSSSWSEGIVSPCSTLLIKSKISERCLVCCSLIEWSISPNTQNTPTRIIANVTKPKNLPPTTSKNPSINKVRTSNRIPIKPPARNVYCAFICASKWLSKAAIFWSSQSLSNPQSPTSNSKQPNIKIRPRSVCSNSGLLRKIPWKQSSIGNN